MATDDPPDRPRRLPGDQRRAEILAAAADVIDAQGFLPAAMEQVARSAGVSKALIYTYFPTQGALCNALLRVRLSALASRIGRLRLKRFESLAVACAELYFDDAAQHGALLHILLTDPYLDRCRDVGAVAERDAIWRRLARAGRTFAPMTGGEQIATLAMILAIPEELGRLAHRGQLAPDRARQLCAQLVLSALRGARQVASATP